MAVDFFTPPATRDLDEAQGRVDAAVSGAGGRSVFSSAPEQPAALDQQTLKAFEDSAVKYNVPVDVLMAMPFLKTYRTICLAPSADFRRMLEDVRELGLAA